MKAPRCAMEASWEELRPITESRRSRHGSTMDTVWRYHGDTTGAPLTYQGPTTEASWAHHVSMVLPVSRGDPMVHGASVVGPWCLHGVPRCYPSVPMAASVVGPWCLHGGPRCVPWCFPVMGPMCFHGGPVVNPWCLHGAYMVGLS